MEKLRLLITKNCDKNCVGCCNKDWNLDSLPICTDFSRYDEIILTGGEPLLYPSLVSNLLYQIRKSNQKCKLYLYTAKSSPYLSNIINHELIDGVVLTLHNESDVKPFYSLDHFLIRSGLTHPKISLRLNVFKGIEVQSSLLWKVKRDMEWIKDCPLPVNEVFMKLKNLM